MCGCGRRRLYARARQVARGEGIYTAFVSYRVFSEKVIRHPLIYTYLERGGGAIQLFFSLPGCRREMEGMAEMDG